MFIGEVPGAFKSLRLLALAVWCLGRWVAVLCHIIVNASLTEGGFLNRWQTILARCVELQKCYTQRYFLLQESCRSSKSS